MQALLSRIELGRLDVLPLTDADVPAIARILQKYADQNFDLADICLMHLAERESISHVFRLDHRHFSIYRPAGGSTLHLLPASRA